MNTFWLAAHGSSRHSGADRPVASPSSSAPLRELEQRIDRLEMICEALWNLLKERSSKLADEDLMAHIAQLDLSDGVADGKVKRGAQTCPDCNRPNARRHDFCIYCGKLIRRTPF